MRYTASGAAVNTTIVSLLAESLRAFRWVGLHCENAADPCDGHADVSYALLSASFPLQGMTALYIALRHSNEGAVKALLEHAADVDMRSGDGRAPIVRPPSPPLLARFGELVFLKFVTCELTLA
jgi:hypothetical protein